MIGFDSIAKHKEIMVMSYKKYRSENSGRSMIEIIGVLTIMSLISVAAVVLVQSGLASHKRARAIDEVSAIVENVRGLYPDGFERLTTDFDTGTKLIDALYLNTVTPFGSETRYGVMGNKSKDVLFVALSGLNEEDCAILSAQSWVNVSATQCYVVKGEESVSYTLILTFSFGSEKPIIYEPGEPFAQEAEGLGGRVP